MDDVMGGGSISFRHKLMGYTGACVAFTQTCFKPKEPFTSLHLCVALQRVLVHKDPRALSCLVPLCPKNNEIALFLTSLLLCRLKRGQRLCFRPRLLMERHQLNTWPTLYGVTPP